MAAVIRVATMGFIMMQLEVNWSRLNKRCFIVEARFLGMIAQSSQLFCPIY